MLRRVQLMTMTNCIYPTTDVSIIESWFDSISISDLSLLNFDGYIQKYNSSLTDKETVCSESTLRNILAQSPNYPATSINRKRLEQADATPLYIEHLPEGEYYIEETGFFHYPPGGYIGWHTNSDRPGLRTYISCVEEVNKSYFRYYDANTDSIVTDWDTQKIMVRQFRISADTPFWHCVGSDTNRISLGMVDIR